MSDVYEGVVSNEVVDTYGGNYKYALQLDLTSVESIFWIYEGKNVRVIIEEIKEEEENEL